MSKGIPHLKYPQAIEKCSSCIVAKMRKMARGGPENKDPTAPGQMMSMYFGFMFHKSKNSACAKKLTGINGGTSYCLMHDAYTGLTFIVTTSTKQSPITWVMVVLTRLNCKHPRKFIRMDRGGELAERLHQDMGNMICVLLEGNSIQPKYWEYGAYHAGHLMNILPHGDNSETPYERFTGRKPDLSNLRIFGCKMYVLDPAKKDEKNY